MINHISYKLKALVTLLMFKKENEMDKMFLIGFASVYLIIGCLFLLMKFANGLFIKFEKV